MFLIFAENVQYYISSKEQQMAVDLGSQPKFQIPRRKFLSYHSQSLVGRIKQTKTIKKKRITTLLCKTEVSGSHSQVYQIQITETFKIKYKVFISEYIPR